MGGGGKLGPKNYFCKVWNPMVCACIYYLLIICKGGQMGCCIALKWFCQFGGGAEDEDYCNMSKLCEN